MARRGEKGPRGDARSFRGPLRSYAITIHVAERPRILVVEPSKALRETICEILIRAGFYPCPAETMERAKLQLVACQPHVVVTSYTLDQEWGHHHTGAEFVALMHERGKWIPIVGVSGRQLARKKFGEVGVSTFLDKPFNAIELLDAVRAALAVEVGGGGGGGGEGEVGGSGGDPTI